MEDLVVRWANTFNSGHPKQVVSLYCTDGVLVPTLEPAILLSRREIFTYLHDLIVNKGAKVQVNAYTKVSGVESGFYTFTLGDGSELVARFTFVPRRGKIVTHHSSEVP